MQPTPRNLPDDDAPRRKLPLDSHAAVRPECGTDAAEVRRDGREEPADMPVPADADVTKLLQLAATGDPSAEAALVACVYDDMRRQAAAMMRRQRRDHTLDATGLLHEAWLRIARGRAVDWKNRGHYFAVAARAMRSVLIDHARAKASRKRGDGRARISLNGLFVKDENRVIDLLALDEALRRLAERDEDAANVVEMRFFGGLTAEEAAISLGVSLRKVERDWEFARTWLRRELDK
jgi:RNA polymerase sigma-70 factor (ECF subfamily)